MAGFTVGSDRVDARTWISFDGTGTISISDDYQVSSLTDHGTGDYGCNTDFTFSNLHYAVVCGFQGTKDGNGIWGGIVNGGHTTSQYRVRLIQSDGNYWDCGRNCIAVFGN
jgi:hypothetical protein